MFSQPTPNIYTGLPVFKGQRKTCDITVLPEDGRSHDFFFSLFCILWLKREQLEELSFLWLGRQLRLRLYRLSGVDVIEC
jgi:hypothetical protein